MNKDIFITTSYALAKQRNLFMALSVVAIFICFLLSLKLIATKEKIILVPGLKQEVWTRSDGVSRSYIEEVTARKHK